MAGIGADITERAGELAARLLLFVLVAALVVLCGKAMRPLVRSRLARRNRPSYTRVFTGLYSTVVMLMSVLLAATLAFPSVQMVDVLASLGIVSVAVGFAFKDVLENLLAGVLLLLRDPFKAGDQIRVGEYEGTVEGITVRETLLRTHDGQRVLLPNAQVYTSPLEVLTHNRHTRTAFTLHVDAGADVELARRTVVRTLREVAGVLAEPAPEAVVSDMGIGELSLECRMWTRSSRSALTAVRDQAIPAVLSALTGSGVALADGGLLVRLGDSDEQHNRDGRSGNEDGQHA